MWGVSPNRAAHLITTAMAILAVAGCVRLPEVDAAGKGPQIDALVKRIKCDLYEGFAGPLSAPAGYEWLHTWTAQANLNLIVTDQSQLTPGAVLTGPLKAVTVPAVVTNFAQSFNFGLGAQASNTATRNENITFTVSMEELIDEFGTHYANCPLPGNIDLQSELGIKEWITQALSPVEHRYLDIGYHKPPKSATTAAAAAALKTIQDIGAGTSTLGAAIGESGNGNAPRPRVLPPDCIPPARRNSELPSRADILLDLTVVVCDLTTFQPGERPHAPPPPAAAPPAAAPIHDLANLNGNTVKFVAKTIRDIRRTINDLMILGETGQKMRTALENTAVALAVFVDPPIDALSHQAQFIILLNASASPSWTLLQFKGPSPASGSLVAVTKTKTHTLNLAIGPAGSSDASGALLALQTGTALTNALNTSSATVVIH